MHLQREKWILGIPHYKHNLQGRLANNDFISVGELSELREGLSSIAGARAARLEAAISRYDYKEARAVLAELMTSVCAATDL